MYTLWSDCEAIVGATAETVTLTGITNYMRIDSAINDLVYIKFNWETGDTEVSATNFDVHLGAYGDFEWIARFSTDPGWFNARVISATSGRVTFMGW